MRAIIFGIMSQFTIALAVFVINRKLTTVNPFLLNFLLAGLGAALLLPVLWFNLSRPFFPDTQILGWILLSAFLFIALGETFYVLGIQAAEETRDLRPFALTALLYPVIIAVLESKRNPLDRWFFIGFVVMAIGFAIIVTRQR